MQRPLTRSFDVFFDLHLNKRLSKQWWGWGLCYDVTVMMHWSIRVKCSCVLKTCVTNSFVIAIQLRWKFRLSVTTFWHTISLQWFAHDPEAGLSCHVQNVIVNNPLDLEWANDMHICFIALFLRHYVNSTTCRELINDIICATAINGLQNKSPHDIFISVKDFTEDWGVSIPLLFIVWSGFTTLRHGILLNLAKSRFYVTLWRLKCLHST